MKLVIPIPCSYTTQERLDMRQYVGTVGPKGQITLPSEVRKELGIGPKDRVVIEVESGSAVVRRAQSSLLEGYRSIHAKRPGTLTD